jgi:transposase
MRAYSKEFRRDVLAACDVGGGTLDVANQFRVSLAWVRRIKQQRRETGQVAPKTTRNRRPTWEAWADWLREAVAETPDAYLRELQVRLKEDRGIEASENLIGTACHALKLTRKKKRLSPLNRTAKTSSSRGRSGEAGNRRSTPTGGSSSTKRGPKRT